MKTIISLATAFFLLLGTSAYAGNGPEPVNKKNRHEMMTKKKKHKKNKKKMRNKKVRKGHGSCNGSEP
jgi:hypothetical protein